MISQGRAKSGASLTVESAAPNVLTMPSQLPPVNPMEVLNTSVVGRTITEVRFDKQYGAAEIVLDNGSLLRVVFDVTLALVTA